MSDTTKTIEELKAELAAAEQKLYEEKQELLRKEREAKYEAERIEQEKRDAATLQAFLAIAEQIVDELKAVGFTKASYKANGGKYPKIICNPNDSNYESWNVAFEDSYRSEYPRGYEVKVVVGRYDACHRYPKIKAGGFSYKKIAATAWEKYQDAIAQQKRANTEEENKTSNEARITRLTKKFGKPNYEGSKTYYIDNVSVSHYTYHSGNGHGGTYSYRTDNDLMLDVKHLTEEQAALLIQFMVDNGIVKEGK